MKLKKTTLGNYTGWYEGYHIFIFKRPHGSWCGLIRKNWKAVAGEGFFGTSLRTLATAKEWAKNAIDSDMALEEEIDIVFGP